MDRVCYVYKDLILKGQLTLEQVPEKYRASVEELLNDEGKNN